MGFEQSWLASKNDHSRQASTYWKCIFSEESASIIHWSIERQEIFYTNEAILYKITKYKDKNM